MRAILRTLTRNALFYTVATKLSSSLETRSVLRKLTSGSLYGNNLRRYDLLALLLLASLRGSVVSHLVSTK